MLFRQFIDHVLAITSCCLLAIMVIAVAYQVIMRYIFNAPSSITESIILVSFMGMILLGGTYTAGQHKHLSIELLKDKVSPKKKIFLTFLATLAMFIFASLFLIYGGYILISNAHAVNQFHSGLRIQMSYILSILPLSGLCMLFYSLHDFYLLATRGDI